jgi:hypothetical protein
VAPVPTPPVAPVATVEVPQGEPCGALGCRRFADAESALAAVIATEPRVLAVGEAHAQKGSENVTSPTRRFTEALLPLFEGKASDLVLELMIPGGGCEEVEKKTAEVQKPVVERQAESNQNEFVTLGNAAMKLGIRPHLLVPKCDDLQAVVRAGPDGVAQMLTMIAELTDELVRRILARNERTARDAMVIAYGGAIHNDVTPREGREAWSFGPSLMKETGGRYIALDLIVPEYIKDNDTWRALPWYEHFDPEAAPDRVTLFQAPDGSYTLIFPRS